MEKKLLTTPEAAAYLGITPVTLRARRHKGTGPHGVAYGSRVVKYARRDLDYYVETGSTSPAPDEWEPSRTTRELVGA